MSVDQSSTGPADFEDLGPATISGSRSYVLRSKAIGQDFLIDVAMPPYPVAPGQTLPVVYILDGNASFGLATQTARMLQMGPYPLPPTITVSIGYHFARPEDRTRAGALRTRDLTPSVDQLHLARFRAAPAPWTFPEDLEMGGAATFSAFIAEELKPFIAERYPVKPGDAAMAGMSLGGLFVLHTLFTTPDAFTRYIALSPAIYWDERRLFETEAALAQGREDLPARLFLSVGGLEEGHDVDSRMVSNLYELEARLRQRRYPSLDLSFHVFPDETHMSVFPGAFSRGLTAVFGGHRNTFDWSRRLDE